MLEGEGGRKGEDGGREGRREGRMKTQKEKGRIRDIKKICCSLQKGFLGLGYRPNSHQCTYHFIPSLLLCNHSPPPHLDKMKRTRPNPE